MRFCSYFFVSWIAVAFKLSDVSIFARNSHYSLYILIYSFLAFLNSSLFQRLVKLFLQLFFALWLVAIKLLKPITAFHINSNMHSEIWRTLCHSCVQEEMNKNYIMEKVEVIFWDKFCFMWLPMLNGAEWYFKNELEEICSQEKVLVDEVINFLFNNCNW